MARERWPKARRSSGANQRALRSVSGFFLFVMMTPVRDLHRSSHRQSLPGKPRFFLWRLIDGEISSPHKHGANGKLIREIPPNFRRIKFIRASTKCVSARSRAHGTRSARGENCLRENANSAKPQQPAVDFDFRFGLENLVLAKILIVDDDSAVQATIRILLERAGHSVVAASDGRKGLAIFEAGDFDLLLLDIFMPGMDGLETMRLIHQQRPLIPIIVISGRPIASDPGAGLDFLAMATKLGA